MRINNFTIKLLLVCFVLLGVYAGVGLFVRNNYLDKALPFPTWTYDSNHEFVNVFTSWDSGFYYDIANTGYPMLGEDIQYASVSVPARSWIKVFMGGGQLGEQKVALPYTTSSVKSNNTVFLLNPSSDAVDVPIYYAYAGIPYCIYTGEIDEVRDVLPAAESLTNASACGEFACDRSYITYYDVLTKAVVYQEYYDKDSPVLATPMRGSSRPLGVSDAAYQGFGCKTINDFELFKEKSINYRTQYTPFSFMPLYPMLSGFLAVAVGDIVVSGLIISFVATLFSAYMLYRLSQEFLDSNTSKWIAISYLLFAVSFYLLVFLPISLFNLFFFASLYLAKKRKYGLMCLAVLLLAFTNIYGVLVVIPIYFITNKNLVTTITSMLVGLGALVAQTLYLYPRTGDFLILLNARRPWYGGADSFVGSYINYLLTINISVLGEFVIFLLLLVSGIIAARKLSPIVTDSHREYFISFVVVYFLISILNGGPTGLLKFAFVLVPLFFALGYSMTKHKYLRLFLLLMQLISLVLFAFWTLSSRVAV